MLLPRCSEKGAEILAQRIIADIAHDPIGTPDEEGAITVRVGLSSYPLPLDDSPSSERSAHNDAKERDTLIRYARHALYHLQDNDSDKRIQRFSQIEPVIETLPSL